jgi:hypothetical protein
MGPESTSGRESFKYDRFHRSTGMWLLDFNQCHQCQKFAEGAEGVLQLQKAFYFNDPYYPQPISDDPRDLASWKTFKGAYPDASERLTDSDMSGQFIDAVEREGQRRAMVKTMFD